MLLGGNSGKEIIAKVTFESRIRTSISFETSTSVFGSYHFFCTPLQKGGPLAP